MRQYYNAWNNVIEYSDDDKREDVLQKLKNRVDVLDNCCKYFDSTNINEKTKRIFRTPVISLHKFLERLSDSETTKFPQVCTIGTNLVENSFSIIKSRIRFPSALEFCRSASFAWWFFQHENIPFDDLGFEMPKREQTTHYRGNKIIFKVPKLPVKKEKTLKRHSKETVAEAKKRIIPFLPMSKQSSIRQKMINDQVPLICPIKGCKQVKSYISKGWFEIHLRLEHKMKLEDAKNTSRKVVLEAQTRKNNARLEFHKRNFIRNSKSSSDATIPYSVPNDFKSAPPLLPQHVLHDPSQNEENIFLQRVHFVDVETTSLTQGNQFRGITAVGVQSCLSDDVHHTLSNPSFFDVRWEKQSMDITGLDAHKVRDAPHMNHVVAWLHNYLTKGGSQLPIIVAHNVSFEKIVLEYWMSTFALNTSGWTWVDSRNMLEPVPLWTDSKGEEHKNTKKLRACFDNYVKNPPHLTWHQVQDDVKMLSLTLRSCHSLHEFYLQVLASLKEQELNKRRITTPNVLKCNCKTGCLNNRCACRKNNITCSDLCHKTKKGSCKCENLSPPTQSSSVVDDINNNFFKKGTTFNVIDFCSFFNKTQNDYTLLFPIDEDEYKNFDTNDSSSTILFLFSEHHFTSMFKTILKSGLTNSVKKVRLEYFNSLDVLDHPVVSKCKSVLRCKLEQPSGFNCFFFSLFAIMLMLYSNEKNNSLSALLRSFNDRSAIRYVIGTFKTRTLEVIDFLGKCNGRITEPSLKCFENFVEKFQEDMKKIFAENIQQDNEEITMSTVETPVSKRTRLITPHVLQTLKNASLDINKFLSIETSKNFQASIDFNNKKQDNEIPNPSDQSIH